MPLVSMLDTFAIPRVTQTLGTIITSLIPPRKYKRTKISFLQITSGGTAHTWYMMMEKGRTTLYSAAAASATSLVLSKDPGLFSTNPEWVNRGITPSVADNGIAANDYIALRLADGTMQLCKPSAVSTDSSTGRVTLTVSAIGAAGALAGATVWFFGAAGDSDPHTGAADPVILPPTSATTTYPASAGAGGALIGQSFHPDSPILLYNANATAASVLDYGTAAYGD
jgi:hypothetical protein